MAHSVSRVPSDSGCVFRLGAGVWDIQKDMRGHQTDSVLLLGKLWAREQGELPCGLCSAQRAACKPRGPEEDRVKVLCTGLQSLSPPICL